MHQPLTSMCEDFLNPLIETEFLPAGAEAEECAWSPYPGVTAVMAGCLLLNHTL